jgi:preprotein translocase subunit SecD
VFMAVYYRLPGVIADIALVIYSLLTFAVFNLLGVTLTLPGIAGFILSIGMAVDANVLIFERTREELRTGKTLYRSVEAGFYRAFSSILDSNVTTLIACAALFWLGAGLVKGFALTLALGVVVSMFTALTCSRTLLLVALSFPDLRKPYLFCPNLPPLNPTQSKVTP